MSIENARSVLALLGSVALALPLTAADARAPSAPAAQRTTICGWIHNPTPANWWIVDRYGELEMSIQGGYEAPGFDRIPDLSEKDWVVTNASSYGYGCGCISATVDRKAGRVTRIFSFKHKPLAVCRADRKLPKP